ncbi:unnamed protein product [Calicophoron daubneyi]|uniref:ASX DEUBAD domain-containing protein n=1 Tax=Calicophoron daubneyi TaxID=300641 RepID=A0AAV2TF08_CALDB
MYATSKLIIPPKLARNSPYIPKLRIRLRPSLSRGRLAHTVGNSRNGDRNCVISQIKDAAVLERNSSLFVDGKGTDDPVDANEPDITQQTCPDPCFLPNNRRRIPPGKRCTSKRKRSSVIDEIDLNSPESVLTKISLKALINRDTFYSLPPETQRVLADLLPFYDHQKEADSPVQVNGDDLTHPEPVASASEGCTEADSVWLHPSALNNEFFSKALQDYAVRQSKGEFAPRVRNRAGLRASAGNRCRYTGLLSADVPDERPNPKASLCDYTSNSERIHGAPRSKSSKLLALSSRASNQQHRLRTPVFPARSLQSSETYSHTTSAPSKIRDEDCLSKVGRGTKKIRRNSMQSLSESNHLASGRILTPPRDLLNESPLMLPSSFEQPTTSASSPLTEPSSPSAPFLKTASSISYDPSAAILSSCKRKSDLSKSPVASRPSSLNSTENDRLSGNFDSSTVEKSEVKTSDEHLSPPHIESQRPSPVEPTLVTHTRQLHHPSVSSGSPVDRAKSLTSPRCARTPRLSNHSQETSIPPSMPPPRQTKTLASMREKLRAKRLLKEAERQLPSQNYYSLPGSMTPHPASGACGYFHQPTSFAQNGHSKFAASVKRSSSSLSSPRSASSPFNCDRHTSVGQTSISLSSLLSGSVDTTPTKFIPGSPSSPHSLPSTEMLSPFLSSSMNSELLAQLNSQENGCCAPDFQSYPSSPHSTSSSSGLLSSQMCSGTSCSPQPVRSLQSVYCDLQHEQSASAPPTPVAPQIGQNNSVSLSCSQTTTVLSHGPYAHPVESASHPYSTNFSNIVPQSIHTAKPLAFVIPSSNGGVSHAYQSSSPSADSVLCAVKTPPSDVGKTLNLGPIQPTSTSIRPSNNLTTSSQLRTSRSHPTISTAAVVSPPVSSSSLSLSAKILDKLKGVTELSSMGSLSSSSANVSSLSSGQNRPSTTTRAFFVDGDNLPEAVALLQSLNPKATITQQQFFLIPSANKSQMFLCRAPPLKTISPTSVSTPGSMPTSISKCESMTTAATTSFATSASSIIKPKGGTQRVCPNPVAHNPVPPEATQITPRSAPLFTPVSNPVDIKPRYKTVETSSNFSNTSNNLQNQRSLVCSKSVTSSQIGSAALVPLKPYPRLSPSVDTTVDSILISTARPTTGKVTLPPCGVTKPKPPDIVVPATQSHITISLLTQNPSVISGETPMVLVSDRNHCENLIQPHTRQLSMNVLQPNHPPEPSYYAVNSSIPLPAPANVAVINSPQLATVCDIQSCLQPASTQQLHRPAQNPVSELIVSHGTSIENLIGVRNQTLQATIRTAPITYATSLGSINTSTTFLSPANIVTPCLPAVVFPHPIAVQQNHTTVATSHGGDRLNAFTNQLP